MELGQNLLWVIGVVSLIGFYLAGKKLWWSWYINLGCLILLGLYVFATGQLGFLAFVAAYLVIFADNAYKWTKDYRVSKKIWDSEPGTSMKFGRNTTITRLPNAEEESNLVKHARHELALVGEDPDVIDWYARVIQAYSSFGHSGGSAWATVNVLEDLLRFRPLTSLTDDPDEWMYHGPEMWDGENGIWQNKRDGRMFSPDGGKTYTCVDEHKDNRTVYTSLSKEQWKEDHANLSAN